MKKISMIIFALFVATNASTFSELEKRVTNLEQQVAKLTIKLLDREMAKESPILKMAVDTTTSISGLIDSTLIESDEDEGEYEGEDEYIEVDEETYYKRQRYCVDYCTEQFNKSWNQSVEAAHQCMDECMRF